MSQMQLLDRREFLDLASRRCLTMCELPAARAVWAPANAGTT